MPIQQPVAASQADIDWAKHQRRLTDVSTAMTAAGATGLGAMLAGKTKLARKVMPAKLHAKLQSGKADDVRNSIALASMIGGVASGAHWSKKLKRDAQASVPTPQQQAENLAKAMMGSPGGLTRSSVVRSIRGPVIRRASYRRAPMPRPRRVF